MRNNFVSRSYQGNLEMGGYAADKGKAVDCVLVNNTTYQGKGGEIVVQNNCDRITIKNNILVHPDPPVGYIVRWGTNNTHMTIDNNLYFGGSTSSPGDWPDAAALFADPQLVNPPLDLHIAATSPAIDRGVAWTPARSTSTADRACGGRPSTWAPTRSVESGHAVRCRS